MSAQSALPTLADRAHNATPVFAGTTVGNNLAATNVGSDPLSPCPGFNDVWYVYTATCDGVVTVDTCGAATDYDTVLTVYDGTCGPHGLTYLNCNDDYCGPFGLSSSTTFNAASGMTYFIAVSGFSGLTGTFALNVSCAPGVPTHDECAFAIQLDLGHRVVGSNVGATSSAGIGCNSANDVWFIFTPTISGNVTVTTDNPVVGGVTNYDTVLNVFTGVCGSLSSVGCNDDVWIGNLQSEVTFAATGGVQYWVSVGGYFGNTGRFGLKISQDNDLGFRFWDQGPGTIGFTVNDAAGAYYMLATVNAGNYPNGWFYGIDISMADLLSQLGLGLPFVGSLSACGTVGPFGPLPAGLTIYGVTLGAPALGAVPTAFTAPASFTIL